jgi:hypothetical protein
MIFVGIDDTDMPDTPGTNKLAMHLSRVLADVYATTWIVRHQLLVDPRVPCTRMNGGVSLAIEPRNGASIASLAQRIRDVMLPWCPAGSDPGLCIARDVPLDVQQWGQRAQRELLTQGEALELARSAGIHLEPLGGTGGGIIGALAAVGLLATWNSGRVIRCGRAPAEAMDVTGVLTPRELVARGVDRIERQDTGGPVDRGSVELGKRLRPNLRDGQVVLYVLPHENDRVAAWHAQRVVA